MELTEILDILVGIKSVSGDKRECHKLINLIANMIPGAVVSDDNNTIWWGHTDLSTTKWLINTHIDVVPASVEQFKLKKCKDKIYGRGALDVKGCAAILISNADRWVEIARNRAITFMFVSDEEIGGVSTKKILKNMNSLKGAIFLEPTNLQIVTEAKGMMQIKITSTGISSHGSRPWEVIMLSRS